MQQPVVIVGYDPDWPAVYTQERARILDAVGDKLVAIEHVGSTAVPGLAAEPIIDMMPGVRTLADAEACIEGMERLGYTYVPDFEDSLPDRRYFSKRSPGRGSSHHVHMAPITSKFWQRHILFRDYLRAHPEDARAYGDLKQRLAAQYGRDREGYTNAKTEFITQIEEKARAAHAAPLHQAFIRRAIDLALQARALGNEPFGALLVLGGVVVYETTNKIAVLNDATAHAELNLIQEYSRAFKRSGLHDYTLYASTEPCAMCAGAIHWAKISRVVYSVPQSMLQTVSGGEPKRSAAHVINSGRRQIEVIGPLLPDEGVRAFEGYVFGGQKT
jgi:GrpB-like predicted nucleotidyltransferase (UPF0157 family)/tRNA(Arg) A34 adenosine deaminase TadA